MSTKFGLDVYDALAFCGLVALLYGIAQWSHAAAWVVGGLWLLVAAVTPELRRKKR
jgi:hypothetical protein